MLFWKWKNKGKKSSFIYLLIYLTKELGFLQGYMVQLTPFYLFYFTYLLFSPEDMLIGFGEWGREEETEGDTSM